MALFQIPTGELLTNTYIIAEDGEATIVDPGDDHARLANILTARGYTAKNVLITHGHFDHIGAVAAFQRSGARVYISKLDYDLLKKTRFYFDLGFNEPATEPFTADVEVSDGDEFELSGHKYRVISTPGHTPGGVCFIMDDKVIFTGDTLFRLSVGRTDFPYGDSAQLLRSVKKLFALSGDYEVYPGHGCATTLEYERRCNPYAEL